MHIQLVLVEHVIFLPRPIFLRVFLNKQLNQIRLKEIQLLLQMISRADVQNPFQDKDCVNMLQMNLFNNFWCQVFRQFRITRIDQQLLEVVVVVCFEHGQGLDQFVFDFQRED